MGLQFNLYSGATLKSLLDTAIESAQSIIKPVYRGYSQEIQETAQRNAEKAVVEQAFTTLPLTAAPKLDKIQTHVEIDSSNWTGRNYNGFKKPDVKVTAEVLDENKSDAKEKPFDIRKYVPPVFGL